LEEEFELDPMPKDKPVLGSDDLLLLLTHLWASAMRYEDIQLWIVQMSACIISLSASLWNTEALFSLAGWWTIAYALFV
jgi:hypothetical protein